MSDVPTSPSSGMFFLDPSEPLDLHDATRSVRNVHRGVMWGEWAWCGADNPAPVHLGGVYDAFGSLGVAEYDGSGELVRVRWDAPHHRIASGVRHLMVEAGVPVFDWSRDD